MEFRDTSFLKKDQEKMAAKTKCILLSNTHQLGTVDVYIVIIRVHQWHSCNDGHGLALGMASMSFKTTLWIRCRSHRGSESERDRALARPSLTKGGGSDWCIRSPERMDRAWRQACAAK